MSTGMRDQVQRIRQLANLKASPADIRLDVRELVEWVYADQRAHQVDGRGIGLHEGERVAAGILKSHQVGGRSGMGRFLELMQLGCLIDREGYDMGELHPFAEAVNRLVIGNHLGIIVRFAEHRSIPAGATIESRLEPDWKNEPAYDANGRPRSSAVRMKYDEHRQPVMCCLRLDLGPDYIQEMRAEYVAWHDALSFLVKLCDWNRADLWGAIVTPTKLQREPWREA